MENTLDYITKKFKLDLTKKLPITFSLHKEDLAKLFAELGYNSGAEIGVEQGKYSEILCQANSGLRLYSIDIWTTHKGYPYRVSQEQMDESYNIALKRLAPYNCKIIKKFSVEASKDFPDNSLDFVYIDGSHEFLEVTQDIYSWSPKVRTGGIISGHDYKRGTGNKWVCHVKDVVCGWCTSHHINPWFELTASGNHSWMWVK